MNTALRNASYQLWILWGSGVVLMFLSMLLIPRDGLPLPSQHHHEVRAFAAVLIAFSMMAFAMFKLQRTALRALLVAQILANILMVFAPAMPSMDVYMYLGDGDMLTHAENPWSPPILPARSEITRSEIQAWENPPPASRYGPVFVGMQAIIVRFFGGMRERDLIFIERVLAAAAAISITRLIRGPYIRFWALSPFVLYFFGLEAHNDVIFLFLIACSIRLRQPLVSGAAIGIAASIKVVAVAAIVTRRNVATVVAAASTFGLLAIALPQHSSLARGLREQGEQFQNSVGAILMEVFRRAHLGLSLRTLLTYAIIVVAFLVSVAFIRWRRRDAMLTLSILFILALPTAWPWYFGWSLFSAMTSATRTAMRCVTAISLLSIILEIPTYLSRGRTAIAVDILLITVSVLVVIRSGWLRQNIRSPIEPLRSGKFLSALTR